MYKFTLKRKCTVFHRSLLHISQMFAQCYGTKKLFRIKTAHSRVSFPPFRLPNEDESTLQFYNDFASSLTKAEIRPDTERS